MTLYRTSHDAKIIGYLCDAARNGKQVAVVVELKARFDEAANIQFANRLEDFGIHVTYGVVGYKTHSKVILVVRQDYNGIRRYAHIGTGNYHPGTARMYADFGLLTSDDAIGRDLTELFNYLTSGYRPKRNYIKILPAPAILKNALLDRIEREIRVSSPSSPGLIQMKMNALEDVDITRALYRAARAGVKIDLIVRDTCRLRPGIPGLSESVRVVSIVGRFLEHGRIYYFRNGGAEEYFIGSADCMTRNLESRVEVVAPVEDPQLRRELRVVLDAQLKPNRCQWEMQTDGTYISRGSDSSRELPAVPDRFRGEESAAQEASSRLRTPQRPQQLTIAALAIVKSPRSPRFESSVVPDQSPASDSTRDRGPITKLLVDLSSLRRGFLFGQAFRIDLGIGSVADCRPLWSCRSELLDDHAKDCISHLDRAAQPFQAEGVGSVVKGEEVGRNDIGHRNLGSSSMPDLWKTWSRRQMICVGFEQARGD